MVIYLEFWDQDLLKQSVQGVERLQRATQLLERGSTHTFFYISFGGLSSG